MDRLLKLCFIFCLLIITLSVAYYFFSYLPAKDKAKEKQVQVDKGLLDSCLDQQFERYSTNRAIVCKELGRGNECVLPVSDERTLDSMLKNDQESCYKRFPIK